MLLLGLVFIHTALAANSFAGSNLYYAAGLSVDEQHLLFSNLQSVGVKVLRVWLDGQGSPTKGTYITPFPSLEPNQVGVYDDTVLNLYDDIMVNANTYGIKLLISMHSFNALQANDVYGQRWGTGYFYENQSAFDAFDNRLRHVITHTHKTLGKQWKDLSKYIFAFEAENEAMIGNGQDYIAAHQYWQCDRAKTIKAALGSSSGILITTGGESWLDESMQPDWFTCAELDVLAIHAYGTGDFSTSKIQPYVTKALQNGKKLLFQEWGACYYNTENNNCPTGSPLDATTRANNLKTWANQISSAGVPWMYWQVLPNKDPHQGEDYEIGINDTQWDTFQSIASNTKNYNSAFDYSAYIIQ